MQPLYRIRSAEIDAADGLRDYPDLADCWAYWDGLRGTAFAPLRSELDPLDLKSVLPRVMLVEVTHGEPPRFLFRLSGTGICDVHGRDLKTLYAEELQPPEYGRMIQQHYCECLQRREPLAHLIALETSEKLRSYARIILPFRGSDDEISHLLVIDSAKQNSLAEFLEKIEARLADGQSTSLQATSFSVG